MSSDMPVYDGYTVVARLGDVVKKASGHKSDVPGWVPLVRIHIAGP